MIGNELFRLLTNLGEKLTKEEAKSLMKELCEPEDEDGFMPFIRKLHFSSFVQLNLPLQLSWRRCVLLRSKLSRAKMRKDLAYQEHSNL